MPTITIPIFKEVKIVSFRYTFSRLRTCKLGIAITITLLKPLRKKHFLLICYSRENFYHTRTS